MNGTKKLLIRTLIILYGLSYFLQNSFFVDRKKVYAAENPDTTNIVAVFVDKNIYQDIKTNLIRYTTKYIQKKIANSKAVVLPIDTTTLKAHEISQILENMYFEGLKDESSKLVGTILMGDIPLPVVEDNGFIYPSIYPYVDFEDQEFIYDSNKKFFVYNNNPNGQAELWHGMIKFDTPTQYNDFFDKVRSYYNNPTTFIDKAIWYEDFIGIKKYFIPENSKYYINSIVFSEDIGYHRYNNLLLNTLTDEHNSETFSLGNNLQSDLANVDDEDLQAYANDIASRNNSATTLSEQSSSEMPTLTLKKSTEEMIKGYDGLVSSQFLAKIKDNVAGLARRYKTSNGETFTDYSSLTDKIVQKDNRVLGNTDNDIEPLLIQINDFLESGLNTKIEQEKYYMTIPIPVSKLEFEGEQKGVEPLTKCTWKTYNYYENYYFGKNANQVTSTEQTNIFRGTFQNLTTISGQNITKTGQSIGGSYDIFSTQVEANRGYNINNTQEELDKYSTLKINKQELRGKECVTHLFGGCIRRKKKRKADDAANEDKCYISDEEKQGGCETFTGFTQRIRGGASPMNISPTTQELNNYDYRNAIFSLYDIAGSRKINTGQTEANSYQGAIKYTNLIQKNFGFNEKQEAANNIYYLIKNPRENGIDIKFTNQYPIGNLENPTRIYNPPQTYAQNNFFTIFTGTTYHIISAGKAVVYNVQYGNDMCGGKGTIYTYKTIDSRVKNISPTRNQISDSEFYKFKDDADLNVFYSNVMTNLATTKLDIANKNTEFSGTSANDLTGVLSNLRIIKTMIASGNDGIQSIISFNPLSLIGYTSSQITNKANERSGKNLSPTKMTELTNRIKKTNEGLESLTNFINGISINNTTLAFDDIIQSEAFKKQKVEILDTRKTNITQNLDYITSNVNVLKSTFTTARNTYNTISNLNNSLVTIGAIQAQKAAINALAPCLPNLCGCDANHYKAICDVLDNLTNTLQADLIGTGINNTIDKIESYQGDNNGTLMTIQPFVEINQSFSPAEISNEITEIKTTMNTFDVSSDPDKTEINKGINLTTQDRPIDNIRNITFQGIGGDTVRFNYPNLYEVETYKTVGNKLILKAPAEIREAIKTYLTDKVAEYNLLLEVQKNKKAQWYQSRSNQFSFLGQLDPLANPQASVHDYTLLSAEYLIDQLITFLDELQNGYGSKYVYGQTLPTTSDEKLDMIAKLLYYQNITRPERTQQDTVVGDIAAIKDSFDINQKISQVVNTYLTEDNDQGKFITPVYNTTGYEVGYINSDGEDYVSSAATPTFITQIKTAQENANTINVSTTNSFIETAQSTSSSAALQADIDNCEGVDTNGTALLFDIQTFSSPRIKAMACWAKKIFKKPFDIQIGFKNALGPVVVGSLDQIGNSLENRSGERKKYGEQRNTQNNDDIIQQADDGIKDTLQGYNNYSIIHLDKTILSVDNTGSNQIKIGMTQDMKDVKVKISGTGDNCFGISRNGVVLSKNICTKAASEFYNPNKEDYVFDIMLNQKKAGTSSIKIELCPPTGTACITKQQVLNIIAGPIATMKLQTATDIIMEGGEVPVIVSAMDKYGNEIGQNLQTYTISVQSGEGLIYDGASANTSISFDKFPGEFIYQAPVGIQANKGVLITVQANQTEKRLGVDTTGNVQAIQKNIAVVKGVVSITENNTLLYQTDNNQTTPTKISFDLPKDEADIQYRDDDGIAQIKPENIPSITIKVQDKNGNKLDTIANITSKQGLLQPGTVKENNIAINNSTKTQTIFSQSNNFIIKDGELTITIYPSFKAGNDTLTINIPGTDPINIPIIVNAGIAKTILLKLGKTRMDLSNTTISTGTIDVVDTRNNKVTTPTTIKLGVIGAATSNTSEFMYSGNEYTYRITAKSPGGEGYVFAYIKERSLSDQVPGYERFIIQDSILPKEKLNVMYLNLFGTDRGNQRGYFSENDKIVNTITQQSNKLLATTTELVDPSKIKQIEYIISPNGQIQSINNTIATLTIENKTIVANMPEIAKITIGASKDFSILQQESSGTVAEFAKDENTILYIPEPTDSIITGNIASKTKITINNNDVIDLSKGTIDPRISITADNETLENMSTYTVALDGKIIGKMMLWSKDDITTETNNINIQDPITYGQTSIFTEGSTNTQGIGIYIQTSAFTKKGYTSIEDSSDSLLGIGFTSDFKNVANFSNGKSVGEATLPYGSQFLINFGDPLLERREKNPEIPDTDFDASIGQTIYADPNKTIFKTLPIDFNKDGIKDLLVVYTDGGVKLIKNYGGTQPYKNLQELMIIAEPIQDIKIGDIDGNGYEDIFVITNTDKGIVYLNDKGIFTVDGKSVCLNVNAEPGIINSRPDDFSQIEQLFIEDMDQNGTLDIVTNDDFGDIKIFYGGGDNDGANYISSTTGTCDVNRYTRQKDNYKVIKRFGTKINSSRYIQDKSLIHRKGLAAPIEGTEEEVDEEAPASTPGLTEDMSKEAIETFKEDTLNSIKDLVGNTDSYIDAGSSQLSYTDNPLSTSPIYEALAANEIYYLPINETNTSVSTYKEYTDINGGILKDNDEVVVQTTIISQKNNNKLTYIDQSQGPRNIQRDSNNKIPSFVFTTNNTGGVAIDRNSTQGYQFSIDNIQLNSGESLSFSYTVNYQQKTTTSIAVQDQDLLKENIRKDSYPDIVVNITDACQKNRRIFFNEKIGTKKTYKQVYDDIQTELDTYNSGAKTSQQSAIDGLLNELGNMDSLESLSSLPGLDSLETRNPKNLLSALSSAVQGGSLNIQTNFIDDATSNVSKKLNTALQGLCQGFKIGKDGETCGIPVPFNQAFLAPGDYHVFGCVPKATHPLYAAFQTLNKTIGKGIPAITIPATLSTATPIPIVGVFGFPQKGVTDGFYLGAPGGIYPSQFRLYIVPTLTLGLGMAMCFGPYSVGAAIPKPARDLGGNCIVFALPALTNNCETSDSGTIENQPSKESLGSSMVAAAGQGTCNNPPTIGNTIVFAGSSSQTTANTASSPFQIVAAGSEENNPHYSAAIPQGNFGGLIAIDQDPVRISADEDYGNATQQLEEGTSYEGYTLDKGEKVENKIVGAKSKGLVKCVVQDWMTRQIQYIQNNLTKMTIQLDLPDMSTVFEGFDKIGNLEETYASINQQDEAAGYIQSTEGTGIGSGNNRTDKLSKQQMSNISQKVGENPFEAIQEIFKEVPLVNIDSKDITIEIPAITSDDVNTYVNYLSLWVEKAEKTTADWGDFLFTIKNMCSTDDMKESIQNKTEITKQIKKLEAKDNLTEEEKTQLETLTKTSKKIQKCADLDGEYSKFISFRENSAGLIKSIKQNINVLEKYKEFPTQLYDWTHLTDRYLTELSALLSDFLGSTTYRLNTNANRFSQYVDSITLLIGTIKTRQAIIDFSVNRSEKCSTCSNDNYGAFSCSLSFLCPKLPVFPIPEFKIPNIYMDMSHIELGMNIVLPKIHFVPKKIALPQIPDLPEPPRIEVDWDILYGLDSNLFKDMSLPTIPVIPEPPTLPEPPSFIPSIKMDLPVLPPAPKIPKILPEINGILKVAEFIGKVFCIVKGGIGLVSEKAVKGKVEQLTQRTWNVPVFDYFDLTTKYKDPPLQGFDYQIDAYATLKFNFDGVYDVFNNIANVTNSMMAEAVEAPTQIIKDFVNTTTGEIINPLATGILNPIEELDQNIYLNYTNPQQQEDTEMIEYETAYNELKQGLAMFQNSTLTDKTMNDRVKTILATVENTSTILPATKQIQQVENAAKSIINDKIQENKTMQNEIKNYDKFIENMKSDTNVLVAEDTFSASLTSPLLTIDSHTQNILQSQEDPTKTYLTLNQGMVQGYLDAVNNDGPEKLNMSASTYKKSKEYLETTKEKIDTALIAYNDAPILAQATTGCTNCSESESTYSTDISAYVNGVFVESYSGDTKEMVSTVTSSEQVQKVQKTYTTDIDLNNDKLSDILMYDSNTIYVKYAQQESEHFSKGNNSLTTYYNKFYSYESEHPGNILNPQQRYIKTLDQLRDNSDDYGYMTINDSSIKLVEKNKEPKAFKTDGQSFDTLQISRKNSKTLGEAVDGYIINVSNKIDEKDTPSSFRDFLGTTKKAKYILILPENTDYKKGLITVDENLVKKPINLELGDSILAVEYFNPAQEKISVTLKDLSRERLYINLATLTITQEDLSNNQQSSFTLYKKSSPRSNQTVAGMQNIGDISAPVGEITLWRNTTNEAISTGTTHEGYINTNYTLKSSRTDNVIVAKMIVQKNGKTIFEKDNQSQTGTLYITGLFFTGTTQQSYDFIAIDQNNNIAKETVTLNIKIPDIEILDVKKSGEETADIVAKISNDIDEGLVIFQRLRNGVRKNIGGSNQNSLGGFELSPKQTIITGGIFTIGNDIGLYDTKNNEIATIDAKTHEIKINSGYENKVSINVNFSTHIPIVELRDKISNTRLFQIVLPIASITDIQMNSGKPDYEQLQLPDGGFGDFNNGYCIKNIKNDCVLYTNTAGAIYIPGMYASSLAGEYLFDATDNTTKFIIKDQSDTKITTLTIQIKETE